MAEDLAQRLQIDSSILRVVLWLWKRPSVIQLTESEKSKIFISSCQLWAPLEMRVDFTINGIEWGANGERLILSDQNRYKLLTSDNMSELIELVEDIQKYREKFAFIARSADVGINRLYAHFNRRVDWNYDLYDLREQRATCPRSVEKGLGIIW
ncbi:hypothetical protein FRC01_010661 [Tulasnella sp. 417]|nr:hypothetical protein FRC01_010661 [Tulasnella sp. 417]